MSTSNRHVNPYIAGRALGQQRGFVGRDDILRRVETALRHPDQNAIVLFGQRRIGKTSILLQLKRRLPDPPFLAVYFDLMDRARRPLGQVLFEMAATLAGEAGMPEPLLDSFDDQGVYFRRSFLPALYAVLGEQRRPLLLLDEFDVLDTIAEEQLPLNAAARTFFAYLRELLAAEPRLKFVFAVGRRAEDLSINVKATFKTTLYQRVSVLDLEDARALIITAQRQGSLRFTSEAVERIIALTGRHPYFTQLLCQLVWDSAYMGNPSEAPLVDVGSVEMAADRVLEVGQNVFEWIWDGLPPAERVIFAAIAEVTDERNVVSEEQLIHLLQSRGIRILNRELEIAPRTLVEWELLCEIDGGYCFFIELMRRWISSRKPLPKVKEELDRVVPLAETLYRSGEGFYQQGDVESAQEQIKRALMANPNHIKARIRLGEIMLDLGDIDRAVSEFEEVYALDESTRYSLVKVLLMQGADAEIRQLWRQANAIYEHILSLSPSEYTARQRKVIVDNKMQIISELELKARFCEEVGEWLNAADIYKDLQLNESSNEMWRGAVERCLMCEKVEKMYYLGEEYLQKGEIEQAIAVFVSIQNQIGDHRDLKNLLLQSILNVKMKMYISPIQLCLFCFILLFNSCFVYGVIYTFSFTYGQLWFVSFLAWIGVALCALFSIILVPLTIVFGIAVFKDADCVRMFEIGDHGGIIRHMDGNYLFFRGYRFYFNNGLAYLIKGDKNVALMNFRKSLRLVRRKNIKRKIERFIIYLENI